MTTRSDPSASGTAGSASAMAGDALDSKSATWAGTDEAPALIERADVARIAFVGFVATIIGAHVLDAAGHTRLLGITATLIGGYPIFKEALENVFQRRMTMELSMTIALTAALAIGEVFTALVITGFVLVAEIVEHLTISRGRSAIGQLMAFLPQRVGLRRGGEFLDTPIQYVKPGDRILVVPGGRIPVDGVVVEGESSIDQATITGESLPVDAHPGSQVFAGSVNQSGALEIEVGRIGRDTTFGRVVEAVEHAPKHRAPIQKIADRLAGYLVFCAGAAAVVTFALTRNVQSTIAVIIVAGACGVAAGTPLAILGAIGRAARFGVIIKGGIHLEALWSIDTVVLDKTGTVTFGDVRVQAVYPATGVSPRQVLEAAASVESRSEHPIGRAILRHTRHAGIPVHESRGFSYVPGQGVRAWWEGDEILVGNSAFVTAGRLPEPADQLGGSTTVFVVRGGGYLGSVALADVPRPEAKRALADLRALKLKTLLLTGDSRPATERVARDLGVDDFETRLMPDAKLARVQTLTRKHRVAMVGDGVNDAPSLIAATVGVAMGSGADVTRESADVVLIGNDLLKFVDVIRLARRTRGIILQNFVGTLVVDSVGIGLAAAGILTPMMAAAIHVSSELLFVFNSARLIQR